MKQVFAFIVSFLLVTTGFSQTINDTLLNGVIVSRDARYDLLTKKRAEINKKAVDAKKTNKGYRIQVLNTTDRTQALAAKSKLLSVYPDQKTYLMYQAPYFKLRFGNFQERKDADAYKKELSKLFPTGVFVIPSDIEVKPEKDKEETQQ